MKTKIFLIGLVLVFGLIVYLIFKNNGKFVKLEIYSDNGKKVAEFKVEIADNPAERAKGLMFRQELGDNQGMLFIFPGEANHSFWMKNTFISLDLIFVNEDKKIVGIIENTRPESTQPLTIDKPSQYILEVNGGAVKEKGISLGDKLKIKSPPGVETSAK